MYTNLSNVQILLSELTLLYRLLQNIFGNEPSENLLTILCSQTSKDALALFGDKNNSDYMKSLETLNEFFLWYRKVDEGTLEQVKDEYTRLFLGPEELVAPPWESVYVSKEPLLFQRNTLEVRKRYRSFGFIPAEYPHVADDHLALELDFMGCLSEMANKACTQGEIEEAKRLLRGQKNFMNEHLLNWVPDFAQRIQKSRTKIFYPNTAVLASEFLKKTDQAISEIIEFLNM